MIFQILSEERFLYYVKNMYSKPQNTFSHQKKTETIFLFSKMAKTIDNMTNHDFLRMGWWFIK